MVYVFCMKMRCCIISKKPINLFNILQKNNKMLSCQKRLNHAIPFCFRQIILDDEIVLSPQYLQTQICWDFYRKLWTVWNFSLHLHSAIKLYVIRLRLANHPDGWSTPPHGNFCAPKLIQCFSLAPTHIFQLVYWILKIHLWIIIN